MLFVFFFCAVWMVAAVTITTLHEIIIGTLMITSTENSKKGLSKI